jgi:hypothetical protein
MFRELLSDLGVPPEDYTLTIAAALLACAVSILIVRAASLDQEIALQVWMAERTLLLPVD